MPSIDGFQCEHKWVYLSTHYDRKSNGYVIMYTKLDTFFCEKCCETREIKREGQEYSSDPEPIWWRH